MIDHLGIGVSDLKHSREFYLAALAPLGYGIVKEFDEAVGFGANGKPSFWIENRQTTTPMHIAFTSNDRSGVDAFYQAAIEAGAQDNGKPGLRPIYHSDYYGAFVLDPDGNNVEAVCHKPVSP